MSSRFSNPALAGSDGQDVLDVVCPERVAVDHGDRVMSQLDVESRRVAVLYFLDELTQEELAKALGLSRRTIGKRLKALVEQARSLLGEELLS